MLEALFQLAVTVLAVIGLLVVISEVRDVIEPWCRDISGAAAEYRLLRQVRAVNQSLAEATAGAKIELDLAAQRMRSAAVSAGPTPGCRQ